MNNIESINKQVQPKIGHFLSKNFKEFNQS